MRILLLDVLPSSPSTVLQLGQTLHAELDVVSGGRSGGRRLDLAQTDVAWRGRRLLLLLHGDVTTDTPLQPQLSTNI